MSKEVFRTEIAKKLRKLRNERNLTSKQVAEAIGISHASYRKYETDTKPPYDKLVKIADFFNVSVDYLVGKEDQASEDDEYVFTEVGGSSGLTVSNQWDYFDNELGELSQEEIELIKSFRGVSENDRTDIADYIKNKETEK